ncbi:MAG: PhzF family phenazine biosynthesis protein [Actinomycetales bacterium]|nr:PhzF family phenazine biosynthesis protein [Candidatus Phosphoribacter baldrii]
MNARTSLAFRLLNVFAIDGDPFSGNPLAVVEDASGLDEARMQAIARQFNLSESTFVTRCPGTGPADADVRIFTPGFEMPFAGHPTLGTAYVIGERLGREEVTLRVPAGDIPGPPLR